jgi:hypothetical protein
MTDWEPAPAVPWDSRWREIPTFGGYYLSQYGQVFSMKRMLLVAICKDSRGKDAVRMYQKSAHGARGVTVRIEKLLKTVYPREKRMDDLEPRTLAQEVQSMKDLLENAPDGEYHIPGVRFSDRNPTVVNLHTLVSRLSFYFPGYMWSTSEALDPSELGMTVRWRRKPGFIQPFQKVAEITQ